MFQGPIITQMLLVCEYWYLTTSILSFVVEATDTTDDERDNENPLALISQAIRNNQDNGVDDWTRLLLHAVFQNSMDELRHATSSRVPPTSSSSNTDGNRQQQQQNGQHVAQTFDGDDQQTTTELMIRRRGGQHGIV